MRRRKWPMWRKRERNYVHTPDRSDMRLDIRRRRREERSPDRIHQELWEIFNNG